MSAFLCDIVMRCLVIRFLQCDGLQCDVLLKPSMKASKMLLKMRCKQNNEIRSNSALWSQHSMNCVTGTWIRCQLFLSINVYINIWAYIQGFLLIFRFGSVEVNCWMHLAQGSVTFTENLRHFHLEDPSEEWVFHLLLTTISNIVQ